MVDVIQGFSNCNSIESVPKEPLDKTSSPTWQLNLPTLYLTSSKLNGGI